MDYVNVTCWGSEVNYITQLHGSFKICDIGERVGCVGIEGGGGEKKEWGGGGGGGEEKRGKQKEGMGGGRR